MNARNKREVAEQLLEYVSMAAATTPTFDMRAEAERAYMRNDVPAYSSWEMLGMAKVAKMCGEYMRLVIYDLFWDTELELEPIQNVVETFIAEELGERS